MTRCPVAQTVWFAVGFVLVLAYQTYAHYAFRGKVRVNPESH